MFIEVKYRTSNKYGFPNQAITQKKRFSLKRAISYYLYTNNQFVFPWSFGVISIIHEYGRSKLSFYKDIEL